jgi:hypothetical protein
MVIFNVVNNPSRTGRTKVELANPKWNLADDHLKNQL